MSSKEYPGRGVTVLFDSRRCIHAGECARGAPNVFDPQARPWIRADRGEAKQLVEVIGRCPTGALTIRNADGSNPELPPAKNTATLVVDGPIYLRGRLEQSSATTETAQPNRAALCRCGASANKPFCDGSHEKAGFKDAGRCANPPQAAAHTPDGALVLNPIANGPLRIDGWFELQTADGSSHVCGDKTWLCRCGASANKPFCDGTHKKIGFTS